jgi:hypothetical protein
LAILQRIKMYNEIAKKYKCMAQPLRSLILYC